MRLKHDQELPAQLTTHDALYAVAKMGGHLTNNGEPGWIVLGRGFDRLLDVELGLCIGAGM